LFWFCDSSLIICFSERIRDRKKNKNRMVVPEKEHTTGKKTKRKEEKEEEELWVINKKVYDLSSFYKHHPGGGYILKRCKGRDCTDLFYSYHICSKLSQNTFDSLLSKYYVREAISEEIESPFNWENAECYWDLRRRLSQHFSNKSTKADVSSWIYYIASFVLFTSEFFFFSLSLSPPILTLFSLQFACIFG